MPTKFTKMVVCQSIIVLAVTVIISVEISRRHYFRSTHHNIVLGSFVSCVHYSYGLVWFLCLMAYQSSWVI